jgi:chemotaxis signal transduction protein
MKYLQVKCGLYDLLLDVEYIVEITSDSEVLSDNAGSRENMASGTSVWKENTIEFIDMTILFGGKPEHDDKIVIVEAVSELGNEEVKLLMIRVNEIEDIIDYDYEVLQEIPNYNLLLGNLVSSVVYSRKSASYLFCLRLPVKIQELVMSYNQYALKAQG